MIDKKDKDTWREWWAIIYHYVELHTLLPERFPLHPNFWGSFRFLGKRRPFPEKILALGAEPARGAVNRVIGYSSPADGNDWLYRRVHYIKQQ